MENTPSQSYWNIVWQQFKKNKTGLIALYLLGLFAIIGLYAPLFASSKPLCVIYHGKIYFPLLRYLFYPGFYTKPIDLFYNLLMFTLPIGLLVVKLSQNKGRKGALIGLVLLQFFLFGLILSGFIKDPASDSFLFHKRKEMIKHNEVFHEDPLLAPLPVHASWAFDLEYMSEYEKLNQLLRYQQRKDQNERLKEHNPLFTMGGEKEMPTLWAVDQRNQKNQIEGLKETLKNNTESYQIAIDKLPELLMNYRPFSHAFIMAKYQFEHAEADQVASAEKKFQTVLQEAAPYRIPLSQTRHIIEKYQEMAGRLNYLEERIQWFATEANQLNIVVPPLFRSFHWEDDAGGAQGINKHAPWWELTRTNRKDLMASLLFGIRISIVVGMTAVVLSLFLGIPLGMLSGYFARSVDLVICRFIEIWEAMPTFFMLLLVVAISQSKSIFLVIGVLGIFGWTGFARFMRAEVLKQRNLAYVMASQSMGYSHKRIMFFHILPNAIPPILTLLPFSMMAAITSEAGLSFLGLGEEGSSSWGVLMDEGRSVFPAESYLLWPPALLLTLLLVCIALAGDALRDAIDPKMRS